MTNVEQVVYSPGDRDVVEWINQYAHPLRGTEVESALRDLEPLREMASEAVIVGIGGSTYGAHEHFTLTTAVVRFLVEELGFRAVATEEDWDVALALDRYVQNGDGDLDALMRRTGMPWRTAEVRAALEWLRSYNAAHDDPVHFVGVGVIDTRPEVYDAVADYVARVAPGRLATLREHFEPIRPTHTDHVRWLFTEATDKEALVEHSRAALRLVEELPHGPGDPERELIVQHARQIVAFYEHYTFHVVDDGYRDEKMAENLRWWHEHTGARIVYWSTNAHSARSRSLRISIPPKGELRFKPTGARLADWYDRRYLSIGLTFDQGEVVSGWGLPPFQRRRLLAPRQPEDFAETPLCRTRLEQFLLDLRSDGPPSVDRWRAEPAKTRVIGSVCDPQVPAEQYWMSGGSLSEWFDVLIHNQVSTPTAEL